jgi:endonuclease III
MAKTKFKKKSETSKNRPMKNAAKHAEKLRTLYKRLAKEHKPEPKQPQDALNALVRGAMAWGVSDSRADEAIRVIEREFVDLNELRVATDLEIQELLGVRYPQIERRVAMITQALNNIFEREHTLSLDRLKTISRRETRQFLRELPDIHPFVEAYVMLFAFDGHCVPVDDEILAILREEEVVDEETTVEEAQRFLEHHLKADECHPFFVAVRSAADRAKSKKKVKA